MQRKACELSVAGMRERKIIPPTKNDLRRSIEAADPDVRVKLIFASARELKAGEFDALRWRNIDFGLLCDLAANRRCSDAHQARVQLSVHLCPYQRALAMSV